MTVQRRPDADAASELQLVLTTCGEAELARRLADRLVSDRLAACVNIVPGVESVYRWEGDIERGREVLVIIKTSAACLDAIESAIRAVADYELPEVLAVPVAGGSGDFLNWLSGALVPPGDDLKSRP